jgi:hypothetical protein
LGSGRFEISVYEELATLGSYLRRRELVHSKRMAREQKSGRPFFESNPTGHFIKGLALVKVHVPPRRADRH